PESSKLPELRFNYGPVEVALAVIYAATEDDKRRKAFRVRINYFQRAKVLGDDVEVGKGKQNAYSIVQIERWLACLELTELGLSPITAGGPNTRPLGLFGPTFPGRAGVGWVRSAGGRHPLVCLGRPPPARKVGADNRNSPRAHPSMSAH